MRTSTDHLTRRQWLKKGALLLTAGVLVSIVMRAATVTIIQPALPPEPLPAIETFESYAVGGAGNGSTLTGGNAWAGATVLIDWPPDAVSDETFESYSNTAGVDPSTLTGGTGWAAAPVID